MTLSTESTATRLRKLSVLVIDDSPVALQIMSEAISKRGHDVSTLPTAIGSTQVILRNDINVVVIDVNLPSMQGDRLAALFRSNPRLKTLAVVLVSGIDHDELSRLAEAAGADAVVSKQRVATDLADAVERAARARRKAEERTA